VAAPVPTATVAVMASTAAVESSKSQPQPQQQIKKKSVMKELPPIPPLMKKKKLETHTRTEAEFLIPSLPLRGGSSTSSMESTSTTSSTMIRKEKKECSLNKTESSSQSLDTDAKPPTDRLWVVIFFSLLYSWLITLGKDLKYVGIWIWGSLMMVLSRNHSTSTTSSATPSTTLTGSTTNPRTHRSRVSKQAKNLQQQQQRARYRLPSSK